MSRIHRLQRRAFFSLAGASLLSRPMQVHLSQAMVIGGGGPNMDLASPLHEAGPALHVAGPPESDVASWARHLQAPLAEGLMDGGVLGLRYGGGMDGVVGANQFAARAAPDGRGALIFPGSVALTWLVGAAPVRLDAMQMLPFLAALGPGVLMVRGGLPAGAGSAKHAPLRLAGGPHDYGSLVALLGLELLGVPVVRAAPQTVADAVFLHGPQAVAHAPALLGAGYAPALTSCTDTSCLPEDLRAPYFLAGLSQARINHDGLVGAWLALAGATHLCAALVLPRLSPSAAIGRWRRASVSGAADPHVAALARSQGLALLAGADAADALAPMQIDAATQIALRRWMARHEDVRRF